MDNQDFIELQKDLAKIIKDARISMKLSQEELALEAGVDRTYVSQLERGIANPSLFILCKIARVMNRDLKIIF